MSGSNKKIYGINWEKFKINWKKRIETACNNCNYQCLVMALFPSHHSTPKLFFAFLRGLFRKRNSVAHCILNHYKCLGRLSNKWFLWQQKKISVVFSQATCKSEKSFYSLSKEPFGQMPEALICNDDYISSVEDPRKEHI